MSKSLHDRFSAGIGLFVPLALALLAGCGSGDGSPVGGAGGSVGGGSTSGQNPAPTPVPSLSATISWAAASGPVAGYHVLASQNGGAFTEVAQTAGPSVVVTGAQGDVVSVRVAAFDAMGNTGPLSQPSDPFVFTGSTVAASSPAADPAPAAQTDPAPQIASGGSDPATSTAPVASSDGSTTDPQSSAPADASGTGGSLGDLDGDGLDDLVWQSGDGGSYVRVTSADLTRVRLYGVPDGGWQVVAVGDFDGDGLSDLLFALPGELAIASGTALRAGSGVLTLEAWAHLPADAAFAASGDFDGDGATDAAVVEAGTPSLWLASGDVLALPASAPGTQLVAAGDADGDGSGDLLFTGTQGVSLWRLVAGAFSEALAIPTPDGASVLGFADLDGDGAAELALRTAPDAVSISEAVSPFASVQETAPADAALAGCGDYDGDGVRDLLWEDATSLHLVSAAGEQQIALDPASSWHLFHHCE